MDEQNRAPKKILPYIITFIVLTASCIVFEILCIENTNIAWITAYKAVWLVSCIALTVVAFAISVLFLLKRKELIVKSLLSGYIFVLFVLIVLYILQEIGFFSIIQDSEAFQNYIQKSGAWMPLIYILFQYFQVIILPVPSVVSTVAGVALFGAFKTTVYSLIGILAGSFTAFFIGRKLGAKAVSWLVGEDSLKKWQKKLKGKDNLFLTVMFLLPLFPDDILCFLAGLSSMTTLYFSIMIIVCRILAVGATCYSIDLIPFNTTWGLIVWGILITLIVLAFILIYKNMDRINDWLSKRFKVFRKTKNKKNEREK